MSMKKSNPKQETEATIRTIHRVISRQYSAEKNNPHLPSGLRDEESFAALCRCEGIAEALYCKWSATFRKRKRSASRMIQNMKPIRMR